jgi:hypothetical protein
MAQSPFFSPINVNRSDFSAIGRSSDAFVGAFQQAADAIGKIGSAYFEEKGFEQQAADFIKTDMGKEYLKARGVTLGDDPSEAEKMVKGMIKANGGFQNFQKQIQMNKQMEMQQQQEKRQNYLFNQQKQEMNAKLDHFNRVSGRVKNPRVEELDSEISSARTEISMYAEMLRDGEITADEYRDKFNDLDIEKSRLIKQKSAIPNVIPMNELDPDKFAAAYGPVNSPYQAMLKAGAMRQLQERKDKMDLQSMDTVEKALRIKNLRDEEKAAAMAPNFRPDTRIIFDEGEAMQGIQDWAKDNKVQLSSEQMEKMKQQYTIVAPKEILSEKRSYEKDNKVNEADMVIRNVDQLMTLIDAKKDVGDVAAVVKMARLLEPVGILTEPDIQRFSGAQSVMKKIEKAISVSATGKLPESSRKDLRDAAEILRDTAFKIKIAGTESAINEISNSYVNPNDPYYGSFKKQIRERFFSEEYNNIPKAFLDTYGKEDSSKSTKDSDDDGNISIMHEGKRKVVKLMRTLPTGQRVVLINGEQKIIDPKK